MPHYSIRFVNDNFTAVLVVIDNSIPKQEDVDVDATVFGTLKSATTTRPRSNTRTKECVRDALNALDVEVIRPPLLEL